MEECRGVQEAIMEECRGVQEAMEELIEVQEALKECKLWSCRHSSDMLKTITYTTSTKPATGWR